MKDMLGNKVKTGDVLLELDRGYGSFFDDSNKYLYHLKLWQKPSVNDGSGYIYDIDGSKIKYRWASLEKSIKIDMSIMPEGFEYSFKHGMTDIKSKIKQGTLLELIENSNWKDREVTKEKVERYNFMKSLKINKLDDIIDNIEELKKAGYVPRTILLKVLKYSGITRANAVNGEIGIASIYDHFHYVQAIDVISKIAVKDS